MNHKSLECAIAIVVAVGMVAPEALDGRAKRVRIDSRWRDRQITIDGDSGDWQGPLLPIDEKQPVSVAAVNDAQFLYVVLTASDQAARMQIMRDGLIVWFDPAGGDKKHFGIKFPVGMELGAGRGGFGRGRSRGDDPLSRPRSIGDEPGQDPGQRATGFEPANRLEVLGPKKDDAHSFVLDRAPGIEAKIAQVEGSLVYELKVPLAPTTEFPYAIEAKPGAAIGLGLETPKRDVPSRGGPGDGGMGRGGIGGGRRGGGGMGGGRGGDRRGFEAPKPMKTWAVLQLAAH